MTTMCSSFAKSPTFVFADAIVATDSLRAGAGFVSSREQPTVRPLSAATASAETVSVSGTVLLANPDSIRGLEEMSSVEVEREHDVAADRGQRLRESDAGRNVVTARARVDERLVAQGLHEIEARRRGSRRSSRVCDD